MYRVLIYSYVTKGYGGTNSFVLNFIKELSQLEKFNIDLLIFGIADDTFLRELRRHCSRLYYIHAPFASKILFRNILSLFLELFVLAILRDKYHVIINLVPTFTPIFEDITYIHFPSFHQEVLRNETFTSHRIINELYGSFLYVLNSILTSIILLFYNDRIRSVLYLANSNYTKLEIKRLLKKNSIVIYPPVEVRKILKECVNVSGEERQDAVITVSRISYEKNLDVIPLIAYYGKNLGLRVKFIIAGAVKGSRGLNILRRIQKVSKKLNVEDSLLILPNISEEEKIMLFCKSKVYLHPMKNEHFGISVVEAMAAGLPVIVNRSGGPYLDIIEQDKYGFSFENAKEAAELIYSLIMNTILWEFYHKSAIARSLLFDKNIFGKKIRLSVKIYLRRKYES